MPDESFHPQRPSDRVSALDRYWTITEDLAGLFGELALVQQNEIAAKSNTWVSTQLDSITAKDRYATHAAISFTQEKYDLQLSISALEAERLYLDRYLQYTPG